MRVGMHLPQEWLNSYDPTFCSGKNKIMSL